MLLPLLVLTREPRDPLLGLAAVVLKHEAGGKGGDGVFEKVRVLLFFKIESLQGSEVAVREGGHACLGGGNESVGPGRLRCRDREMNLLMTKRKVCTGALCT